ncbi:hypothetical protein HYFRA_00002035 [Hymenoscyphus fraxineus]|uniref:Protein kinase domain-containing protein n=1 Tax=Hymenoscyphus fraxineus TaxID=746836 RepID=A0A9N9KKH5_9HELO|nr:hypothetical protein HYFRA_00002035 [Hymenoscyphus fraxineus]
MAGRPPLTQWASACISRFHEFVRENCEFEIINPESVDLQKRQFMPLDKVRSYFEGNNCYELRAILNDIFGPADHIDPRHILRSHTAVFCILLCTGRGGAIKLFKSHDSLSDLNLPFDPERPPAHLPDTPNDPNFLYEFCEKQWVFCAARLEGLSDKHFDGNRILPIIHKKKIGEGATAVIWLIELYPYYNGLIEDQSVPQGNTNTFVLKEYDCADSQMYYEKETKAFETIGSDAHIVRYFGSFKRGNSLNVLLEYADKGTLDEFFEKQHHPTSGLKIIRFWEEMFKITRALAKLHGATVHAANHDVRGWHQDVNPKNILVMSNGSSQPEDWKFKLADLGKSHIKIMAPARQDSSASDSYGTRTYGAPECSRSDVLSDSINLKIKTRVDIWSLGCIFSEAVRWMAHQGPGISAYREERKQELLGCSAGGAIDCFHDGLLVLSSVRRSHRNVRKELRREDFITELVSNMILGDMLVDENDRSTATVLCKKQKRLLDEAKFELEDTSHEIMGTKLNGSSVRSSALSINPRLGTPPTNQSPPHIPPGYPNPHQSAISPHWPAGNPVDYQSSGSPTQIQETHHGQISKPFLRMTPSDNSNQTSPFTPSTPGLHFGLPEPENELLNSPMHSKSGSFGPCHLGQGHSNPINGTPTSSTYMEKSHVQSPTVIDHGGIESTFHISSLTGSLKGKNLALGPLNTFREGNTGNSSPIRVSHDTLGREKSIGNLENQGDVPENLPIEHTSNGDYSHLEPIPPATTGKPRSSDLEFLNVEGAIRWKQQRRSLNTTTRGLNPNLLGRLKDRDHVFLVDDSCSMAPHWDEVMRVFEALSYIVKAQDRDGLDLYFAISDDFHQGVKKTSFLQERVRWHKPNSRAGKADMNIRLSRILQTYTENLQNKKKTLFGKTPKTQKPLSLYILTNGIWEGDNSTVDGTIENAVKKLEDLRKDRLQIGIQFISFGDDVTGLEKLRKLDDELDLHKDIVDTEPCTGNVWKMLLGPISANWDGESIRNTDKRQSFLSMTPRLGLGK